MNQLGDLCCTGTCECRGNAGCVERPTRAEAQTEKGAAFSAPLAACGGGHIPVPGVARFNLNSELQAALWLGLPAARGYFDSGTLSAEDSSRFAALGGERRRADFEVSRALLAFAGAGATTHVLSHSRQHAALLVCPTDCEIGVDLEFDRPRDVRRLARFAFHPREASAIEAAPEDARHKLFYTLWTLKESFAKALQLPLVDALRQCVFWNEAAAWRGQVPTSAAWSALVFQPRPELFMAAACVGAEIFPSLQQWEWPPQQRGDWPIIACASAPAAAVAVQE